MRKMYYNLHHQIALYEEELLQSFSQAEIREMISEGLLKEIEIFNLETLKPIMINMGVIIIFSVVFIIITNIISKNKNSKE